MKKVLSVLLCALFLLTAFPAAANAEAAPNSKQSATTHVTAPKAGAKKPKVTKKQRNGYYKRAAFIGSSIGLGQRAYFKKQGKNFLGNPVMMVRGCYSFYNDKHSRSQWMITYKGTPMQAKKAIKMSGVKRVFISMGTNDFHGNAVSVYKDYVDYVKGIRKMNPKVVIFIESTTGVTAARQGKYLNSANIAALNEMMKEYCSKHKDMYFIDVSSKLLSKNGHLKKKYSSDNYVHLTDSAYEIWTNQMIKFTDKLILKERAAKKAVVKAEKSRTEEDIELAKEQLSKLKNSTVKDNLTKRLDAVVPIEEN